MSDITALLLTDVVGSTQLSEQLGDRAMAEVWAAHDRAARDLLPAQRGREIDKTDGMLLLFDSAADAVAYALAYHHALAALPVPLRARAGLHVGPVLLRENAPEDVARGAKPLEVDGLAKPMAARVMSLAGGGQTLLTADALQALGDTALAVQSHGHWVMKGVSEPVELFEVGPDASGFAAPPDGDKLYRVIRSGERWLPVKEIPNNLPQYATQFIGRERELGELKTRLSGARLITLLGMGGLGKTRLSLQVAAESMPQFPDGAWFIDLSPIRDPALVVAEAARVLDVAEEPSRPLAGSICAHLKSRRTLLIFDNCEHLIDAAGDLVHALLQAAPQLRVMASSREPLDVPGEQSWPIHPLPLPNRGDGVAPLMRSTAARLFIDRVQAHRPDFVLEDDQAADVADLVVRLEGIPLAIELAAARMRTLGVA
ncbi:MAG TPA: NB-ARC domain-containing protein, partial [Rubrivivax sp.]|nr:NB-ARC domain-containing protein [Rubrivivax sp.]